MEEEASQQITTPCKHLQTCSAQGHVHVVPLGSATTHARWLIIHRQTCGLSQKGAGNMFSKLCCVCCTDHRAHRHLKPSGLSTLKRRMIVWNNNASVESQTIMYCFKTIQSGYFLTLQCTPVFSAILKSFKIPFYTHFTIIFIIPSRILLDFE